MTVSKVEIRLIDPPVGIKKVLHKQKTAEQERRSMRLLATGEFEAANSRSWRLSSGQKGNAKVSVTSEGQRGLIIAQSKHQEYERRANNSWW